jgi:hypothetical protein
MQSCEVGPGHAWIVVVCACGKVNVVVCACGKKVTSVIPWMWLFVYAVKKEQSTNQPLFVSFFFSFSFPPTETTRNVNRLCMQGKKICRAAVSACGLSSLTDIPHAVLFSLFFFTRQATCIDAFPHFFLTSPTDEPLPLLKDGGRNSNHTVTRWTINHRSTQNFIPWFLIRQMGTKPVT